MVFQTPLILDGGFATELENSFHKDLSGKLWSAKCLDEDPYAIKAVHRMYFEAGADIATTCSYQASVKGFLDAGYSYAKAIELMRRSVQLAREARDEFGRGLVALSIGCYGAVLANGAEYTGDYGENVGPKELLQFHKERLAVFLQEPGIDFVLFETIPSLAEAKAIRDLVADSALPLPPLAISFSCQSNDQIADGTPLDTVLALFDSLEQVFAVGVNCTKIRLIPSLLSNVAKHATLSGKTLLCYPDGGAEWDAVARSWKEESKLSSEAFARTVDKDIKPFGKNVIVGGCCGTGPAHIQCLRRLIS
ncbi:hypothetical protein EC973_006426 [Apophysomyces ossiformis]|uniref:Hcy-binding domain-containing protein n=1 Tax=Apophysomyces ossiformis TaxID=679940 RepID=A0A8H7BTE9_9FUNG|nr:hypothetical protein EC973_006426 [Apophysomyces ossiformis]